MTTKTAAPDLTKMPEADLALPAGAPLTEWLGVRSHGVGASDVSGIMEIEDPEEARGIYKDRFKIWEDKTGRSEPWEPDRDHPAHIGNLMEPLLRRELSERLETTIHVPGLYVNRRNPVMRCSVDGIAHVDGELVLCEFKNNGGFGGIAQWSHPDKIPAHPLLQSMYSMHLLGIRRTIVFALAGGNRFERRDLDYDEEFGKILEEEVMDFWNNYVLTDRRPDPTSLSLDILAKQFGVAVPDKEATVDPKLGRALAEEFLKDKKEFGIVKKRREDFKAKLIGIVQDAEKLVDSTGELLFTVANDSTLRVKDLREQRPDMIAKYTVKQDVFDEAAFKAGEPEVYTKFRARSVKYKGD